MRKHNTKGVSRSLVDREQRVRQSRHNKPHTTRRNVSEEIVVAPGTPGARRSVEARDPKVFYPAGTAEVDGLVVVYRLRVQRGVQVPVTKPYTMKVASGPTS